MTKRLNDYYYANPEACRISIQSQNTKPIGLFDHATTSFVSTRLPPAPFLVPVIIDALGQSETYKDVVEVVPGEADLYCGRSVKQHGGLVLTGDSDLLVHDLGADGSTSFFKDIDHQSDNSGGLRSLIYYPATIADRLSLPQSHGLRALAFEMIMDSHGTFRKLLGQSITLKTINMHEDQYLDFLKPYNALSQSTTDSANCSSGYPCQFMKFLRTLDPRISEWVFQFPSIARCTDSIAPAAQLETNSIRVFLPFLVDCPIRTTAWEASTSLRQLAYGLLKNVTSTSEQEYCVFEHRRQNNINGKGYQLPNTPVTSGACTNLINLIEHLHHNFSHLPVPDRWIAFAVYQQVEWSSSAGKLVNSNFIVQKLPTLQTQTYLNNCTWDNLQFLAQVQGVFYSLRMLQQITGLLMSGGFERPCMKEASTLYDQLKSLPPLKDVPSFTCAVTLTHKVRAEHMVQAAYKILGIKEQRSLEVQETSENIRKKRKSGKNMAPKAPGRKQVNNSFELLEVE